MIYKVGFVSKKNEEYDISLIDETGNNLKTEEDRETVKLKKIKEKTLESIKDLGNDLMNSIRGDSFRLNEIEIGLNISNTGNISIITGNCNPSIILKIIRRT